MGRRVYTAMVALLLCALTACGSPLRQFGEQPGPDQPTPPPATVFSSRMVAELNVVPPLAQAKHLPKFTGDPNLSEPLHVLAWGVPGGDASMAGPWRTYFIQMNDIRLKNLPHLMETFEMGHGGGLELVCDGTEQGPNDVSYLYYCREKDAGTPQTGVLVLPSGFTTKLQQWSAANGRDNGWLLASLLASLYFSEHLRHELQGSGLTGWPTGAATDYCVAGISLRGMYPASYKPDFAHVLTPFNINSVVEEQYRLDPATAAVQLMRGFNSGDPLKCA